ncbi:phospholipid-transporting ATPase IK [Tupaia chinensis]|uniref:phospholipid-transporting ATPase IK n=1 Tax=Tupaia chinensis TaxID=246437 RepID=UPI0007041B3F|nr:phospholipid-transporting ATPase IK [Tupaia chinensis]
MGHPTYGDEDYEDDEGNSGCLCRAARRASPPAFTWEVKANDRAYHARFKEKVFLCWRRDKYKTNVIHTAKYSVFSFLPLNLYEQFHRLSNLYFLLVIVLQGIPEISTLPWFTLFAPLVCLIAIRAARDLMDDIGRHRSDKAINNRPCQILTGRSFSRQRWKDLRVGDVVCLSKDSTVPADLVLLASSEPSSLCYVETADIDGETNLKFRQALMVTHHELTSTRKMASFQGTVLCEEPNSRMHHFVGCLEWNDRKYPLDIGNLLLRGCKVRNTDTCYGLVIYAGFDTKIMKNCGKIHLKRTKLDLLVNKLVVLIFLFLVVLSLLLTFGYTFKVKEFKDKHHYLAGIHSRGVVTESFFIFWGFLILLSVMVPMAMFILAEFIYLGNSIFINWDLQMYWAPQDAPAQARSTSLNDHLGQVQYVFSDKTGTLTQNVMTFKKCCIQGRVYGPDNEDGTPPKENPYLWNKLADGKLPFHNKELLGAVRANRDPAVREFWRVLALCHTVMAQEQDVRTPEGSICLYTKGADTVILERLQKRGAVEHTTEEALAAFAHQTLRTLCLAYKVVDEDTYEEWSLRHREAGLLLRNRAQSLHQLYEEIEQDLKLLGVTAIEDRLQDGVPDTIKCLKKGNIKVWVLTGDKQETAVNIGFACQLLSENMLILEEKEISRILEAYWESNNNVFTKKRSLWFLRQVKMAMVINGDFLDQLLLSLRKEPRALVQNVCADEAWQEPSPIKRDFLGARRISLMWRAIGMQLATAQSKESNVGESAEVRRERAFVDLASRCQAVICCRVTPKQKALVVALVKKYQQVVTLAIGDGANDVNMIKTADIGVGLVGQEGMQAVQSSDYALAQFSFLRELLLVHGRWSYMRVCKFLRYFVYKTLASMMAQGWFACYNGFSSQPLYEGWFLALFNLLYSTLPVLYIGLFEQDLSAEQSLERPELYQVGQKDKLFNYGVFLQSVAHGTATSLVNFFVTLWGSRATAGPAGLGDYQSFAVVMALSSLLSITMEVVLNIRYWTVVCLVAVLLSLGFYVAMTSVTQSLWLYRLSPTTFPFLSADHNALSQPPTLLVVLLNVTLNTLPVLAFRVISQALKKPPKDQEEEEEGPSEEAMAAEQVSHFHRESRARRSSYAFSHREGYADLITPGSPFHRESRARRSSYAFSHREGYADLITQGTILRRPRAGGEGSDSPQSDEEPPAGPRESPRFSRKPSFLVRKRRQHRGKVSSEEPPSTVSSSLVEGSAALAPCSENQPAAGKRAPAPSRPMGLFQEAPKTWTPGPQPRLEPPSQAGGSQPSQSPPEDPPLPSSQRPSSGQPGSSATSSSWRTSATSWTSWPYSGQKGPPEEARALPPKTPVSSVETPPPSGEEPPDRLSMEVEAWPAETEPSPMEWLPVPEEPSPPRAAGQPPLSSDGQSLPCRHHPGSGGLSPEDKGSEAFPFSNKPRSI